MKGLSSPVPSYFSENHYLRRVAIRDIFSLYIPFARLQPDCSLCLLQKVVTRIPKLGLSLDIVLPLLSVITMLLSTHISMKASGQQMQGSMKLTMYMMPLMYLFFCFTYPLAFSLYYVISNIVMTVQTQVMRKVYDPDKMRKEIEAQIAEKKKQEKRGVKNTTVKVTDPKTGKTTEKNISASEMNKRRLEYARQLDEERYKDERTVPLSELNKQDKE